MQKRTKQGAKNIHNQNIGIVSTTSKATERRLEFHHRRNKGMSLHIVAPFRLISPSPHGSTHLLQRHFEWQWTPEFLRATADNPLSFHLSLKAQCQCCCSAPQRREGERLLWPLNIRQTARSDWVSPGALTQCTTQLTPLLKRTVQLLHVHNHWPYTVGLIPKRDTVLCLNEATGAEPSHDNDLWKIGTILAYKHSKPTLPPPGVGLHVGQWALQKSTLFTLSDIQTIILKLLHMCFAKKPFAPQVVIKLSLGMLTSHSWLERII